MKSILRLAKQPPAAASEATRTEFTGNDSTDSRGRALGTAKDPTATQRNDALLKTGALQNAFLNRTDFPRITTHSEGSSDRQGRGERPDR